MLVLGRARLLVPACCLLCTALLLLLPRPRPAPAPAEVAAARLAELGRLARSALVSRACSCNAPATTSIPAGHLPAVLHLVRYSSRKLSLAEAASIKVLKLFYIINTIFTNVMFGLFAGLAASGPRGGPADPHQHCRPVQSRAALAPALLPDRSPPPLPPPGHHGARPD